MLALTGNKSGAELSKVRDMGTVFTSKQREELHTRLKYAICWKEAVGYQAQAGRTASMILDELEHISSHASLGRRAVASIVRNIEKTA